MRVDGPILRLIMNALSECTTRSEADSRSYASTAFTVHLLAVQQVSHHWLLPAGVQGSCRSTTPEENRAWRQWVEELQASIEPAFLSKLLEKVVQIRIQASFDSNGLMPNKQSAYRRFHSTETAVTKVVNDHKCRPLDVCQPPQAQRGQNSLSQQDGCLPVFQFYNSVPTP